MKYIHVRAAAFKSLHLAYASKYTHQNTINILYYLNFKVLIHRFHKIFKTYLAYIISVPEHFLYICFLGLLASVMDGS